MNINDNAFAQFLNNLIDSRIESKLKNMTFIKAWVGKVVEVGTGVANIQLAGDTTNMLIDKKNKTGEVLNVGDEVYLYSPYGTLSTSFIAVKK